MPRVMFVIGAVATGKTHFINRMFQQEQFERLDIYDYQQRVYDEEGFGTYIPIVAQFRCLARANVLLLNDVLEKLEAGCDVAVEQTFYKAKRRIAYIDAIRARIPDVFAAVYIMCPSDTLWQSNLKQRELSRDVQRFTKERDEIEFPNIVEGFDAIYQVADNDTTLRMDPPRPEILAKARAELAEEAEKLRLEDEARQKRETLLESMKERKFWHYCEVCGKKEFITAKEAFDGGWDYPPDIGSFGLLGPRTCGNCLLKDTLYMKVVAHKSDLTSKDQAALRRIKGEPESLFCDEE